MAKAVGNCSCSLEEERTAGKPLKNRNEYAFPISAYPLQLGGTALMWKLQPNRYAVTHSCVMARVGNKNRGDPD